MVEDIEDQHSDNTEISETGGSQLTSTVAQAMWLRDRDVSG